MTPQEIKTQYDAYITEGRTPAEARQGVRTWLHCHLQIERADSLPYALRPQARKFALGHPDPEVATAERRALVTDDEARVKESLASTSDAHELAAAKHNATLPKFPPRVVKLADGTDMAIQVTSFDAVKHGHHWAQKQWGMKVWSDVDAAVAAALGGA